MWMGYTHRKFTREEELKKVWVTAPLAQVIKPLTEHEEALRIPKENYHVDDMKISAEIGILQRHTLTLLHVLVGRDQVHKGVF